MLASIRSLTRRFGIDLMRYPDPGVLGFHFSRLDVQTILDVGANAGQYGRRVRSFGYRGRIVSFEPLREPSARLRQAAADAPPWDCFQVALGAQQERRAIHVSTGSDFSSFLEGQRFLEQLDPASSSTRREVVDVETLDAVLPRLQLDGRPVWLKCDTQGFELEVLRGARESLPRFIGVQLELSLRPLYIGQPGFQEVAAHMADQGFVLSGLIPGFADPRTLELFEIDGLFVNRALVEGAAPRAGATAHER
jgi:FkbM family methyltransferase